MTLMKSVLLGSAASLMVVASAQAADLPTKKGAPAAEYVKVCKVGSIAGWIVPGTDTCLKISGFVTGRYMAGETHNVYAITGTPTFVPSTTTVVPGVVTNPYGLTRVVSARQQDAYGTWTRGRITVDAASNTAYGPLVAHMDMEDEFSGGYGEGNTSPGTPHYGVGNAGGGGPQVDKAWITWAGITAGKVESFFDYYHFDGAGNSDMDLFAADQSTNDLAYTATFGGGFSATIAMESPINQLASFVNVQGGLLAPTSLDGDRSPDWVVSLDVKQGWGDAHVAGLLHEIRVQINDTFLGGSSVSPFASKDAWGWGVNGGVTFNLPSLGAGADFKATATYTEGDYGQSGVGSPWYLNLGGVANNGALGDIYYNNVNGGWKKPTFFTVAAAVDLPFGANFKFTPEASYANAHISGGGPTSLLSKNWDAWIAGGTFEWVPVHNLAFDLDLLYEDGHQDRPTGYTAGSAWKSNFDGFIGELRVERDF
jgi:hypothetical protein